MPSIEFGLLDFGTVLDDMDSAKVLNETVKLALLAERCGYARFWLAEHHHVRRAWANPTVMVAHLLSRTSRLRVGPAGILLNHYSALAVANDYSLLTNLFDVRAELGVARGFAEGAAVALGHSIIPASPTEFGHRVEDLHSHLLDSIEFTHAHFGAFVTPFPPRCPTIWIMGSGSGGARLAGRLGLAYCHSMFHGSSPSLEGVNIYRDSFVPGPFGAEPRAAIAVAGLCMADGERARNALPQSVVHGSGITANVFGTPGDCAAEISHLSTAAAVDSVVYLDLTIGDENRRFSCAALSAALGLVD